MLEEKCGNCRFFLAQRRTRFKPPGAGPTQTEVDVGVCRRYPPRAMYDFNTGNHFQVVPEVFPDHSWCGEYQQKVIR